MVNEETGLEKLTREIQNCQRCPLYKTAASAVPGEGNPRAKVFFIGEAPGFWEDKEGRPFVGEAGKLLDRLFNQAGFKRSEVFITNVVKHRPPQNRAPRSSEINACRFWLWEQLKIVDPQMIVALGRFALEEFLPEEKISKVHGQKRSCRISGKEKIFVPIFHPAAALRNRRTLPQLEEDFSKLRLLVSKIN